MKATKGALEEEVVVRQAHQLTEGKLDTVASGLKKVAQESLNDLGRLHNKLGTSSSISMYALLLNVIQSGRLPS